MTLSERIKKFVVSDPRFLSHEVVFNPRKNQHERKFDVDSAEIVDGVFEKDLEPILKSRLKKLVKDVMGDLRSLPALESYSRAVRDCRKECCDEESGELNE
ncbi:MAG: hypothetical protein GY759_07225 [Chloroflexi bacterium]|nr:hypothetical protein [Chloroflexota bacterium]